MGEWVKQCKNNYNTALLFTLMYVEKVLNILTTNNQPAELDDL